MPIYSLQLKTERDRWGSDDKIYIITGPEQREVQRNLNDVLKTKSFQKQLPQFLVNEWQNSSYANLFGDRVVFLDVQGKFYEFQVTEEVIRERVERLRKKHEEADTKICLRALLVDLKNGNLVV